MIFVSHFPPVYWLQKQQHILSSESAVLIQDTWSQYQGVISVAAKTKPPGMGSSWWGVAKQLDCYGNCGATARINLVTGDYVNTRASNEGS